ncbi:hypothetical protein HOLleu_07223 [Holothuria leucospilota]|uniref:Uncharacterized protein n=1 Tax=Holothuria leucospilota TaxID=206669 RepID=A0A9Q1CH91_HOLLE|nr:hypothetical protein HOLleu_07223 [Holothuria leucospilota]
MANHRTNKQPCFHVLGDFNFCKINWSIRLHKGNGLCHSNSSEKLLLDILNDFAAEQLGNFPTRGTNTLDLLISNSPNQFTEISPLDLFSDHVALFCRLRCLFPIKRKPHRLIWQFSKGDYGAMRNDTWSFALGEKAKLLVVGCEDGAVRLYQLPHSNNKETFHLKPWKCLESKGGPIQVIALHDVTKFGSVDIITGDSRGLMTILSNGQILDRQHVSDHSINSLKVDEDLIGNTSIVAGDSSGLVSALLPFSPLWKFKVRPEHGVGKQPGTSQPSAKSLLAFSGPSSPAGHVTNYILVSDDQNCLHVLQQGSRVLTIAVPGLVTAMSSGVFQGSSGEIDQRYSTIKEVALGCHNGTIYIMKEFKVCIICSTYMQLGYGSLIPFVNFLLQDLGATICQYTVTHNASEGDTISTWGWIGFSTLCWPFQSSTPSPWWPDSLQI